MKYEIINPSDECYIEATDPKVAIAAALILGNGAYGLKNTETDQTILYPLIFGGAKQFLQDTFGGEDQYATFVANNYEPIGDALLTASYPKERTSLNDIQSRAYAIGRKLHEKANKESNQP